MEPECGIFVIFGQIEVVRRNLASSMDPNWVSGWARWRELALRSLYVCHGVDRSDLCFKPTQNQTVYSYIFHFLDLVFIVTWSRQGEVIFLVIFSALKVTKPLKLNRVFFVKSVYRQVFSVQSLIHDLIYKQKPIFRKLFNPYSMPILTVIKFLKKLK